MQGAQGSLYEANAEVSRLEAEIRFIVESRNRVQAQIAALTAQREQWQVQAQKAHDEIDTRDRSARRRRGKSRDRRRITPPRSTTRCPRSKPAGATRRRN